MNDDDVAAQCACQQLLDHLRDELHRLAQQAGLDIGELAAEVGASPARARRWFREPDARSADLVTSLAQACVRHLQRRGHRPAPHLCDPQWWRDQVNRVNICALFGVCTAEQTVSPVRTRLMAKAVRPIVRQMPVLTSVVAAMLFAYVLVSTAGPGPVVPHSPSAASSAEASERATEARRQPPAVDRDDRQPFATSSASSQRPGNDNAAAPCAFFLSQGEYAAVILFCPSQGVVLVCPITRLESPARRPHREILILKKCSARS
ncbi:hypothetical protein [Streptomyces iakyrus]